LSARRFAPCQHAGWRRLVSNAPFGRFQEVVSIRDGKLG
jgi:hypothetical protein